MLTTKKYVALFCVILFVISVFFAGCSSLQSIEDSDGALGQFTTTDLDGNEVTQDIFSESKLTMVNIWGTFCGPCISEMPDLALLNEEYADQDFQVIGITIDILDSNGQPHPDGIAAAKEIAAATGADYTHLVPSQELIQNKLKDVSAVPETIFVDEDGEQVGESYKGARSKEQWQEIIEELLEEV